MREIKFRAWDKINKELHEVWAVNWDEGYVYLEDEENKYPESFSSGTYRLDDNDVILMQSTSLKDKNGKKIYEGDVISWKFWSHIEPQISIVEFDEECGGFYPFTSLKSNSEDYRTEETIEIIGNIYENPDLIK